MPNKQPKGEPRCGKFVTHFIAREGSYFPCVLPAGHEGECQRGGTCFKHGKYVGTQCSQFPNCLPDPPSPTPDGPKEQPCGTAESAITSTSAASTAETVSTFDSLLSKPHRVAKKKSDFNSPQEWEKYLDSIVNAPEPDVIVKPDGTCEATPESQSVTAQSVDDKAHLGLDGYCHRTDHTHAPEKGCFGPHFAEATPDAELRERIAACLFVERFPEARDDWRDLEEHAKWQWYAKADAILPLLRSEVSKAREDEHLKLCPICGDIRNNPPSPLLQCDRLADLRRTTSLRKEGKSS